MKVVVVAMSEEGKKIHEVALSDLLKDKFKGMIKFGIATGCYDRSGLPIFSDSFVYYKQELCKISLVEGQFLVVGSMMPLTAVCKEVDVL